MKSGRTSSRGAADPKPRHGYEDGITRSMRANGIPLTRERFLALAYPDLHLKPGEKLDPELEGELPEWVRRQARKR